MKKTTLTAMTKREQMILMDSLEFIKENPEATTHQIPDSLLKAWLITNFTKEPDKSPSSLQKTIFMYIYQNTCPYRRGKVVSFDTYHFFCSFYSFQIILAATAMSRKYEKELKPMKIFDLGNYNLYHLELSKPESLERLYNIISRTAQN